MYDNIREVMIEADIAERNEDVVHSNSTNNLYSKEDAIRSGIIHKITYYFLVADKLGYNISQKSNRRDRGRKYIFEKELVPRKVISNQNKYFIVIVFTALTGKPAMYCIIFSSSTQNAQVELYLDFTKEYIGNISNSKFFEIKFSEGKVYSGSLTCIFRGKWVLYFI